jgi:hypothetical protein
MRRELDHDRLPWNVKDIDADVDDSAPEREPVIQRPAPPEFHQDHRDGLETIGTKMEEAVLS